MQRVDGLAGDQDFFAVSLEPAAHGAAQWYLQLVYAHKTLLFLVLFAQGNQPVVLERRYEVALFAADKGKVLL